MNQSNRGTYTVCELIKTIHPSFDYSRIRTTAKLQEKLDKVWVIGSWEQKTANNEETMFTLFFYA